MCRPARSPGCNLRFTPSPAEAEPGSILEITGEHFGNTPGPRDPNTIFGVNSVAVGDVTVRVRKWRDEKIEVELPGNVQSGDVVIRMASSDPLPDGSCCAPVKQVVSNSMPMKVLASVRVDPTSGPVGTKVVLFGKGFRTSRNPEGWRALWRPSGHGVAVDGYDHCGACAARCPNRSCRDEAERAGARPSTYTVYRHPKPRR